MFHKIPIRRIGILLFWLVVWHLTALAVDNSLLLATPFRVLAELAGLIKAGDFWKTIFFSLLRIGSGFFLGLFVGIFLAVLSGHFSFVEELLSPLMNVFKTIPVASFVVLLLIWWGSSRLSIAISFLMVLPNIYMNTLEGLKSTDKRLLEMAQVFHIPFSTRFFYIYRPTLRPFLKSGLQVALGMCWKSGVAAEVIGTPEWSIGSEIYMSKIYLNTAGVLAWTAVVVVLSMVFQKAVLGLAGCFFTWQPVCRAVVGQEGGKEALLCGQLAKAYGEQQVLSDFSQSYERGQVYYLRQPSGSGKTTLLRLLGGLEKPDGGWVRGNGFCSMMFQEDRLCEDYNALRNLEMVLGDRQKARLALEQLLPEDALDKPCSQLSGGMKRRVALVRAMEAASDAVLLDEPFTGMDAVTRQQAEDYIHRRQQGRPLIIATHI